ncbi:transmembrane protein 186 [Bombyx mandarina]|uniref:Transmembrane protein 186 n=2 Tax=Bombyx TaxID=7090 RepID=A0A8R2R6Q1_BOMMO|nr:transmembrane protein 186 [Bombyx mandarina]XP_037872987.1 transmembrane protein 186 [Bombyx mori]
MLRNLSKYTCKSNIKNVFFCTLVNNENNRMPNKYETVFTFPFIKYIAIFNRLKLYHCVAAGVVMPSCGVLEMLQVFSENTFFTAAYLGITVGSLLSIASLPFKNIIGFLYISDDNRHIKISYVDYWGKRQDKIISANDWIPLMDMAPRKLDPLYLSPHLSDGTKYKLFVKFGKVLNSKKMGEVLE